MNAGKRFTYGAQFDPQKAPLADLLQLAADLAPDRYALQEAIRQRYFPQHGKDPMQQAQNSNTMAMNCLLSLKSYQLISVSDDGKQSQLTDLGRELLTLRDDVAMLHRRFAVHILTKLEGLLLARIVERIRARGEQVTLEYLGEEVNEIGIRLPTNSTYISTMRQWLAEAGVFRATSYEVNWDVAYDLLEVDADLIDRLYNLEPEQSYFLRSMLDLDARDWLPSNKIANHTRSIYKIRLTTKNLVLDVLEPLVAAGLIEKHKTTSGRGAKPDEVRLTAQATNQVLEPLLANLVAKTQMTLADLNRTFEDVVVELDDPDKHRRGVALELFAIWLIRLLGLRFSHWRLRAYQATGGGEVDVMAASDKIVYSRWQIQCKNTKSVGVEVIAKEVGLTFLTKADVVMVVTTGKFAQDAVNYANLVTDNSRYYVILLEGDDVRRIAKDRTRIVNILNIKARRAFAKRELGQSAFDEDVELQDLEGLETEIELEQAITDVAS